MKCPLYNQVMAKYLLFLIYASVIFVYIQRVEIPFYASAALSVYDSLKPGPVCNETIYENCVHNVTADSSLLQGSSMSYGDQVVSEGGIFKLGFFERNNGTYLGIWYNDTYPEAIVWVANREDPVPSHLKDNCSLVLGEDGIAKLLDSITNHTYWSAGSESHSEVVLTLSDNGNLIISTDRGTRGIATWQSFDNPTDTLLQGQGPGFLTRNLNLTAWIGLNNPAPGIYTFEQPLTSTTDPMGLTLSISTTKGNSVTPNNYWQTTSTDNLTSFIKESSAGNSTLRLVMNSTGRIQLWELNNTSQRWSTIWMAPTDQCDPNLVENCASFGVCDAENGFKCKCLPGFEPADPLRWESKDFSAGCTMKPTINNTCGKDFTNLPMIKLPPSTSYTSYISPSDEKCKLDCLNDCNCKAYSYDPSNSNCQHWSQDKLDSIQEEYYNPQNRTISIRVSDSNIGKRTCKMCGTNMIPYPLSTNINCGDPRYLSFQCNFSNGQFYFKPPSGGLYKVSYISPADMIMFVVQLPHRSPSEKCDTTYNIGSKLFNLNNSSPFKVTNCSLVSLIDRQVVEVQLSWQLPPQPACDSTADCEDWPNTSCTDQDTSTSKVCTCIQGFHSDSNFIDCTTEPVNENPKNDHKRVSVSIKAGIASTCGILLLLGIIFLILLLQKRKTTKRKGITEINKDNDIEDSDIPFVDYESILYATDNFSDANKLGVGGFGPVYKGFLVDGKAIAVKRLSATSVQGVEEFRNEIVLIAKLQHRNLVRVLGYCLKEDEKILIYEYMSNKSLDAFLFDPSNSPLLDWIKRFNIILGITRGLLYLHQDSRLRIIHRDLKPSNILLDEELNAKISDFGLARIVAGNEMSTITARVIGTHGYMSPEYALDGYFSIKSDVYSFGIVVLEIISGKRCTSLLDFNNNLISLLGYAWILWESRNPMELVDRSVDSYDSSEVKRCINVALLCVQEDPGDRPTMSNVLLMLSGDNMSLPYPKQPVFVARRKQPFEESSSSSSKFGISSNDVTVTLEGR